MLPKNFVKDLIYMNNKSSFYFLDRRCAPEGTFSIPLCNTGLESDPTHERCFLPIKKSLVQVLHICLEIDKAFPNHGSFGGEPYHIS